MELLVNELSVHEQFHDSAAFQKAFSRVMKMRELVRHFGRDLHCNREFVNRNPVKDKPMQIMIGQFAQRDQRRAAMLWSTKAGPFWDENREHTGDDWFEYKGDIVTGSAVAEAAFKAFQSKECGLVSFSPSDWEETPLRVVWQQDEGGQATITHWDLENFWACETLQDALTEKETPIQNWSGLEKHCRSRFKFLTFTNDCFEKLKDCPFSESSSKQLEALLEQLDLWTRNRDDRGKSNEAGRRIYQQYFVGDRAAFSDSSATEKQKFRKEMTFKNPDDTQKYLFCPWHGKISHQTLRLHFHWPVRAREKMYIVYTGPKITKQ